MAEIACSDCSAVQGIAAGASDIGFVLVGPQERFAKSLQRKKGERGGKEKKRDAGDWNGKQAISSAPLLEHNRYTQPVQIV